MSLLMGAALGGMASSGIGSAINYGLQISNYNYQKRLQQEAWGREDSAVTRRMADLKNAGLSQTLAAGSAAASSNPIHLEAPQIDTQALPKGLETAQIAMGLMKQKADIAQTVEQTKLNKLQQDRQKIDNAFASQANPYKVTGLQQSTDLAKAMNPKKLESMALAIQGQGFENAGRRINNQLSTVRVDNALLANVRTELDNQSKGLQISSQELDLIAKQIAIDMAQHNYNYYESIGLPSNGGSDSFVRGGSIVGNAFGNVLNQVFKHRR